MKLFNTFRLEILETTVCFCIGMSYEEIHEYVEENHHKDCVAFIEKTKSYGYGKGYFAGYERMKINNERHYDFIIYLGTWEFDDYHYTTLAHEAYHITSYLQKIHGIATKEWEFLARLHTQIMNEALTLIRDCNLDKTEKPLQNMIHKGLQVGPCVEDKGELVGISIKDEEAIDDFITKIIQGKVAPRCVITVEPKSQHIWVRLKAYLREELEKEGYINKETYTLEDGKDNTIILNIK